MEIVSINEWNNDFFQKFVDFRNKIHKDIVTSFPETIQDYEKYFGPSSPFLHDYFWNAFLVTDKENVVAKAILCWRKGSDTANLGFLDWENSFPAAEKLISALKELGNAHKLKHIKSPVDLNFYVKYRIRLPGGGKPFWGEPIYPDYYHELFQKTGFQAVDFTR